jgi:hypothetical protein
MMKLILIGIAIGAVLAITEAKHISEPFCDVTWISENVGVCE